MNTQKYSWFSFKLLYEGVDNDEGNVVNCLKFLR